MQDATGPRYAIYYVPAPGTALALMGRGVIGYDVDSGTDVPFVETCGMGDAAWTEATREPRGYGFHATLKAPFRLLASVTEFDLTKEVGTLAARLARPASFALAVEALTRFVALVPNEPSYDIERLASEVVVGLDGLRAPLTVRDRERRLAVGLTERQRGYLEAYGYPYVREEFRFHLTLAGPLIPAIRNSVKECLKTRFEEIDCTCVVDALTVLRQDHGYARFRVIARCPLALPPDGAAPQ